MGGRVGERAGAGLPTKRHLGFTLIEMLVVLVILALSAGLMMSRVHRNGGRVETRGAATLVMQGLREARSDAIGSGQEVAFAVDARQRRFQIGNQPPRVLPGGVDIALDQGGRPATVIAFAPDGSSPGGRVVVVEKDSRIAVRVDWLTGRIAAEPMP